MTKALLVATLVVGTASLFGGVVRAEDEHQHHEHAEETVTITGEVLDMGCYLSHGAAGEKHADCAKTCIASGLPVGLKGQDGKTYLVIGEHKPINAKLAEHAGKTVTLKGKATERDGIRLLANAELVK
jgi:hypothetical protein